MAFRFDVYRSMRVSERSGLCTGIAADGSVFQFRNAHASQACLIRRIEVAHLVTTGYTGAQEVGYYVKRANTWTVAPTGGTALTLTTTNLKLRATDPVTCLTAGDLRIATTSALTDGTVTLDAHYIGCDAVWALAATAGGAIGWNAIEFADTAQKGLLLGTNEGFVIKNLVAQGASGVGRWYVNVMWDEGVVTA